MENDRNNIKNIFKRVAHLFNFNLLFYIKRYLGDF